ncbi:MAG: hypothetical protein HC896_08585 [Bacteroidales bacterium]|nr:hypothetical protein [Bacteroidales bacterium]
MKLIKKESYKRGIVFSSMFNGLAKVLNFLQTVAIAFYFGTINSKVDVYFYCFGVISLLTTSLSMLNFSVILQNPYAFAPRSRRRIPCAS